MSLDKRVPGLALAVGLELRILEVGVRSIDAATNRIWVVGTGFFDKFLDLLGSMRPELCFLLGDKQS